MNDITQKLCDEIEVYINSLDDYERSLKANSLLITALIEIIKTNFLSRMDKERLDWLADTNNTIGNVTLPAECVEKGLEGGLRGMIDLAMEIK